MDPDTGVVDTSRITEPGGIPLFTLTIRHIPYSTEQLTPGVSHLRLFNVEIRRLIYQFAAGDWEYTLQDHAVLRCYAYRCTPQYKQGTLGVLRIPKAHVQLRPGRTAPPTLDSVSTSLLALWKTVHPSHHHFAAMVFPFPYTDRVLAGSWDLVPECSALDKCTANWEEVKRWKDVRRVLNQRRLHVVQQLEEQERRRREAEAEIGRIR